MNPIHTSRLKPLLLLPCLSLVLAVWSGSSPSLTAQQTAEQNQSAKPKTAELPDTSRDDSEIIRVMLSRYSSSPEQQLLVLSETEVPGALDKSESVAPELQKAFQERNRVANSLNTFNLSFPGTVRFFSKSDPNKAFEKGGWNEFHTQYPDARGYIALTLPGYSADKKTALMTIDRHSGGRSGSGALVVLTKKNGIWQISQTPAGWRY